MEVVSSEDNNNLNNNKDYSVQSLPQLVASSEVVVHLDNLSNNKQVVSLEDNLNNKQVASLEEQHNPQLEVVSSVKHLNNSKEDSLDNNQHVK